MVFRPKNLFLSLLLLGAAASLIAPAFGQDTEQPAPAGPAAPTMFPHPDSARYLILGQTNIIFQAHGPFHSPYSGPNSFLGRGEYKTSLLGTLYLGYQLNPHPRFATDILYDEESSGGRGISEALGLAGFTNLDVVRNPSLGSIPYMARVQLHQVIGFTDKMSDTPRTQFSLAPRLPERRLDLHVGKMSLPDYLDVNAIGTDSHLQFMNWTVDNNGAWDYAADTRGYTYGMVSEYVDDPHAFTARYAIALMPTVANGTNLEWNLRRASGQNVELELRKGIGTLVAPRLLGKRAGVIRTLTFVNHANMGDYRQQNQLALATGTTPVITAHPATVSVKYGLGLNVEQELTSNLRAYGRFGWNEGQHESYAYTEVDQSISGGLDLKAAAFSHRENDKIGVAFVSNAIKRDHQAYLALGGQGFLLGDGHLHYAREDILEAYYNLHAWRGVYYALDAQYVTHPGYNQDRGPALVESVRMHVDF
ncbi:carbohydrate porin [Granulicella tundricola]|uniref:Carbohydrate-selective porin OprB n=1 Tax=Granulicella tundricola (strain ATCC BAA-1859 / DSM 23138 / MP5ACTX9) TaxID=1198114 RepID=E8X4M2_GRATM|nr:carbohydrate porin [Granulicella tundricola]ADW69432.1 Carbohydrate-selective porin OprB [Granulicella tundricola MP5ACTX9]